MRRTRFVRHRTGAQNRHAAMHGRNESRMEQKLDPAWSLLQSDRAVVGTTSENRVMIGRFRSSASRSRKDPDLTTGRATRSDFAVARRAMPGCVEEFLKELEKSGNRSFQRDSATTSKYFRVYHSTKHKSGRDGEWQWRMPVNQSRRKSHG